ncbi:transposase [Desulfamplus magnetovallimortis]|uniref:Transposase n=1 Tax=Desulfamplus magnetovallimortis TaxID=1246637 RepID=A0A1W1HEI3_9BACT|nr:IS5 family transposase [Desulfamplus magnetovallimortis]SLM30782.1 transposase [Desulfamplus magnetovallimortis]
MSVEYKKKYPTDVTDSEWEIVLQFIPKPKSGKGKSGRPASDLRNVFNGIRYVNKTGCQWRMLPNDFGPWSTIYGYYNKWSKLKIWKTLMDELRKMVRKRQGRKPDPSAGSVDSQSVKSSIQGESIGIDGGKLVKGRKRHILVDTLGLILSVIVTPANEGDRNGLKNLLTDYFSNGISRLRKIWVDGGYSGSALKEWVRKLKKTHQIDLEVSEKEGKGFNVVKKRWVVERTFAWIYNFRRNSKDYERKTDNSEAMIQISMISILLNRLS